MIERYGWALVGICILLAGVLFTLSISTQSETDTTVRYVVPDTEWAYIVANTSVGALTTNKNLKLPQPSIKHIQTPENVKGIYMSAWVAGTPSARKRIVKTLKSSDLNAVVVDIKDYSGNISYTGTNPELIKYKSYSKKIPNIESVLSELHSNNIYVIGRLAVFEDNHIPKLRTDWALYHSNGSIWKNNKKLTWVDPYCESYWKYIESIAYEAYTLGFDEINFDYIRFPTDGPTSSAVYQCDTGESRSDTITAFIRTMREQLVYEEKPIPLSADVFGMTTSTDSDNDNNIGQSWVKMLPYVDALCPMVYPSHYPTGSFGYENPAAHPGSIITHAMKGAVAKTVSIDQPISKIRPWIQDFNLGARYGIQEVKAQIQAASDLNIESFLSWDPSNRYTTGAYGEHTDIAIGADTAI